MVGFGLVVLFVLVVLFMRGGGAMALFDLHAFLVVVGGSMVAATLAMPAKVIVRMPRLLVLAAVGEPMDQPTMVAQLVKASERVRASGRAAALGNGKEIEDSFLKTGLGFVADGFEPKEIRSLLEAEMSAIRGRHRTNVNLFESLGGYCPTFGILGTVEAMVAILGNLSTPDKLGPEIALAMVATLYGVGFANLLFLPVGNRLKKMSEEELRTRQVMVDVIVGIQEGAKPEFIRERLRVSLPPETRRTIAMLSERRIKKARTAALGTQELHAAIPETQE